MLWKKRYSGYSSIGRTTVCGIVCSLFKSGSPHFKVYKYGNNLYRSMFMQYSQDSSTG